MPSELQALSVFAKENGMSSDDIQAASQFDGRIQDENPRWDKEFIGSSYCSQSFDSDQKQGMQLLKSAVPMEDLAPRTPLNLYGDGTM